MNKSLGSACGYFFLLILVLTVLKSAVPVFLFATVGEKAISTMLAKAPHIYPANLQINITNGMVTTNVHEPYYLYLPNSKNTTLLVIDTTTPFSAQQFTTYHTIAWLGKNTLFVKDQQQGVRAIDLSQLQNVTLNQSVVAGFVNKIAPIIQTIGLFVPVIIFIGLYFLYMLRLIYLFFLALFIWIVGKFMKKGWGYGTSYKIGLYAMTAGFLLDLFFGWTTYHGFGFMMTVVSLLVVIINFAGQKSAKTSSVRVQKRK